MPLVWIIWNSNILPDEFDVMRAKLDICVFHFVLFYERLKRLRVMVFNATSNNISVISWSSVLLVEETGVPGESQRPATSH